MYKPKDSDIFNASRVVSHPGISTAPQSDPSCYFQQRSSQNYDNYRSRVASVRQTIAKRALGCGDVD